MIYLINFNIFQGLTHLKCVGITSIRTDNINLRLHKGGTVRKIKHAATKICIFTKFSIKPATLASSAKPIRIILR